MDKKQPRHIGEFERQATEYARQWASTYSRRGLLKAFGAAGAAAALAPSALAAAPSGGIVPSRARRQDGGATLKVARGQLTDSLDPQKTALLVAHEIMWQIYDSLIYLDEKGTVHPGLATEWTFSEDNLAVTYKLREGVKFHDGTPFDAQIVKDTVTRHLDAATASPTSYMLGPLDTVEVVDPMTVTYKYKELFAPMFVGLGYSYCAPISIPAAQASGDQFGRNPVGTGAYKFVEWSADDTIVLEANPEHSWATTFYTTQQPPAIQRVEFHVIPEDATRLAALESGEVDVVAGTDAVPTDKIRSLETTDGVTVYKRDAVGVYYSYLNQQIKPLDDLRVRQAINHAVDRDKLVQLVLDGQGKPATSALATAFGDYNPDIVQYPYDPEKAAALMKEAGLEAGFETKYLNISSPVYQRAAESIQEDLSKINIKLSIESYPVAEWVPKGASGEYGIQFFYYTYSDPDILYLAFRTGQAFSWSHQDDPELDGWLDQQQVSFDPAVRKDLLHKAQARINEQALSLLLWEGVYAAAMRENVQNLAIDLVGFIHLQEMSLK
ncbi:MAG: peptide/nickel transport system substrate-binding protein [Thermomicrobiales bacterium]|nr:peptide/nickel transport system substrate-binding protein [Thermomicrobiales bacterium]MEA2525069.1 peptide/nickel transport system substrate-binding protein [Thermomicrobiales bacterium]